ncbi:hypothetical protein HY212_02610 [Candidatus Pacearchaeota archaeon]|nr:hypothetical protein [Candidatus Pacearchaeota archaeon]
MRSLQELSKDEKFSSLDPIGIWRELCGQRISEIDYFLTLTYNDGTKRFTFKVNHVEPVAYMTTPVLLDYGLYVNIEINDANNQAENRGLQKIYLGSSLDESPRKIVPFGQRYFEETEGTLNNIIMNSWGDASKLSNMLNTEKLRKKHLILSSQPSTQPHTFP